MSYVEFLRARSRVYGLSIFLAISVILVVVSSNHSHVEVDGSNRTIRSLAPHVPLSVFLAIAGFIASAIASFYTSINRLSDNLPAVWTKPVSRERIALSVIAVDCAALVVFWLMAVVAGLIAALGLGLFSGIYFDDIVLPTTLLSFGAIFMSYGNAQAVTAWNVNRGGPIAGILYGSYFVILALAWAPLAPGLHAILMTLNVFNPLAYYGLNIDNSHVADHSLFTLSIWLRIAILFAIGLAGCVFATFSWKRMEI